MEWHRVREVEVERDCRILVYSPVYEGRDENMLYRIIDSNFLNICEDAEWFAYLSPPEGRDRGLNIN
jgi:hypothetical protein